MFNDIRSYEYDPEDDIIILRLSTGGKLRLDMDQEYLAYYGGACDIEIEFTSDDLKELFFMVDNKVYAAYQLVQWAMHEHQDIMQDAEQEARGEADNARVLSSPRLTGRI